MKITVKLISTLIPTFSGNFSESGWGSSLMIRGRGEKNVADFSTSYSITDPAFTSQQMRSARLRAHRDCRKELGRYDQVFRCDLL
jgi:hypothetical protein